MTIIEKIKQSVEGATGMPFLYHAAGELNELIARCGELPVAYSFLIDSGTIDDVNGRYHERVTIAVMFCDKTEFDFNALENEQIIDRMKVKAYKWMQSLRMSNALRVVSVNNTQRLYDNTTDILTGFAVNITLEDIAGVGECELPDVVFEIKENGEYPVVGIDKVFVNVLPKFTDIVITENGEYHPNDYDVDAFSKVDVDVKPKLEDLTATDNGTYTPSEGFDGFGKVNVDLRGKVKVTTLRVNNDCINSEGRWEGDVLIDTSEINSQITFNNCYNLLHIDTSNWNTSKCTSISFAKCSKIKRLDTSKWNTGNITTFNGAFQGCYELQDIDVTNWNMDNVTNTLSMFNGCSNLVNIDTTNWNFYSITRTGANSMFLACKKLISIIGDRDIDDVLMRNVKCLNGNISSLNLSGTILERPSLRAVINGLADLSDTTTQTLTLGSLKAKLTEEDIAIATNKNWTIA